MLHVKSSQEGMTCQAPFSLPQCSLCSTSYAITSYSITLQGTLEQHEAGAEQVCTQFTLTLLSCPLLQSQAEDKIKKAAQATAQQVAFAAPACIP